MAIVPLHETVEPRKQRIDAIKTIRRACEVFNTTLSDGRKERLDIMGPAPLSDVGPDLQEALGVIPLRE